MTPRRLFLLFLLGLPSLALAMSVANQWQLEGNNLYQKGDKAGAIEAYKKSLQADPSNQSLADFIAKIAPQSTLTQNAVSPAADQAALEETLDDAKNLLAEHKYGEALGLLEKAQKVSPSSAAISAMLGDAYYGLGLAATARQSYQKSLALEKDQPAVKKFVSAHLPSEVVNEIVTASGDVNYFAPLWRSAIIPGWGQVYNGQASKGVALGIATLSLLGAAYGTYQAADSSYNEYAALGPGTTEGDFNTAYDKVQNWATLNHVFTVLFYAAYVYNVGNAATGARPQSDKRAEFRLTPSGTPQLALTKNF